MVVGPSSHALRVRGGLKIESVRAERRAQEERLQQRQELERVRRESCMEITGGAWPFLVGGLPCQVDSGNERDLSLLTSHAFSGRRRTS